MSAARNLRRTSDVRHKVPRPGAALQSLCDPASKEEGGYIVTNRTTGRGADATVVVFVADLGKRLSFQVFLDGDFYRAFARRRSSE